jgi:hypothetical protein
MYRHVPCRYRRAASMAQLPTQAQTPAPGAASSTSAPRHPPSKAYTAPTESGGSKDKGAGLDWSKLRSLATGGYIL